MPKTNIVSLRDILYVFFKNKNIIFLIFFIALISSLIYILFASPVYVGETKLLVKIGREKFTEVALQTKESYGVLFQERTQNIYNEIEILKSQGLTNKIFIQLKNRLEASAGSKKKLSLFKRMTQSIKNIVKQIKEIVYAPLYYLGLSKKLTEEENLRQSLYQSLGAELVEDTDVISLTFRWNDPGFAAFAVNLFAKEYIFYHIKTHQMGKSYVFYLEQISSYEQRLKDKENELENFLKVNKISNIAMQKEVIIKFLSEIEDQYNKIVILFKNANIKINKIRYMYESLNDWVETPSMGKMNSEFTGLKALDEAYFKLKIEYNKLIEDFSPKSKDVITIANQIKKIRRQKYVSLINILDIEIATLESEERLLKKNIIEKKKLLEDLDSSTLKLSQLRRERKNIQVNYFLYKKKAEELRISDDLNKQHFASVKIMNTAYPPIFSVYPKKKLTILLSSAIGVFIGFLYSFILEFFNHTFKNERDIESILGIPLLFTIPKNNNKNIKSIEG